MLIFVTDMGRLADFFSMTRHERVGTLAVMALLAVAIVVAVVVRGWGEASSCDRQAVEAAARFAAESDTATASVAGLHRDGNRKPRHRPKKSKASRPRKSVPDRPLNPVPSF